MTHDDIISDFHWIFILRKRKINKKKTKKEKTKKKENKYKKIEKEKLISFSIAFRLWINLKIWYMVQKIVD